MRSDCGRISYLPACSTFSASSAKRLSCRPGEDAHQTVAWCRRHISGRDDVSADDATRRRPAENELIAGAKGTAAEAADSGRQVMSIGCRALRGRSMPPSIAK